MVTSMREHKGYLYLGGISNNRIGKYRIPGADKTWEGFKDYSSKTDTKLRITRTPRSQHWYDISI